MYILVMVFIYILRLEQGEYYVGKTANPDFRIESHFNSEGSAWTKLYKLTKSRCETKIEKLKRSYEQRIHELELELAKK